MATDWQLCRKTLRDLIERELVLAHELGEALAGECDALRSVDPAALDAATARKQDCVENLARLDSERRTFCASYGISTDRSGMEQLLVRADPEGSLTQSWQTLLTRLETCREANQKNGMMLRMQRRRVTEALGILKGETANNAVYGDSGELDDTSGSHVHAEI